MDTGHMYTEQMDAMTQDTRPYKPRTYGNLCAKDVSHLEWRAAVVGYPI